jgi:hypothetical protein
MEKYVLFAVLKHRLFKNEILKENEGKEAVLKT